MKYIKTTALLFVVSILFVAYSTFAQDADTIDEISLPALKGTKEMATKIKTTTLSQYYYNAHTTDNNTIRIMLRRGDSGSSWKDAPANSTIECPSPNLTSQTGTYTIYGKNKVNRLTSIKHDAVWYHY